MAQVERCRTQVLGMQVGAVGTWFLTVEVEVKWHEFQKDSGEYNMVQPASEAFEFFPHNFQR